ncbi:deoxyribodipyrimidine photo-lyase [Psychrobacter sp. HY3-MNA-CIBAN-0198]|jgi:deoxyribodipyrimidine photo-lyase|uniref:deoxyribodipyrimidine photo-lyase n=1 Tax=Psychrobacter sp. HY3-MNA-CIBAN-0198 TaxID=3140441 RepID=UPI003333F8D9
MSNTASATTTTIDDNDGNNNSNDDNTSLTSAHYLMWFRRDLRLHDNTALAALCERARDNDASVSALFFLTPEQWQTHDMSLVQLDHIARTLPILANDLHKQLNITLHVQVCDSFSDCVDSLDALCAANNISCVMANHEYEGNEIERDAQLSQLLAKNDIEFIRWHDQCILPPKSITTNDDSMYQVFTPFYKKWRHTLEVSNIQLHKALAIDSNR